MLGTLPSGQFGPSWDEILSAREILRRYFGPTRLIRADSLCRLTGRNVHLKLEGELPTGSFKVRGAIYALAVNMERRAIREVVASSTGNHGAAVAYASHSLGVPSKIFLPMNANEIKKVRIAEVGASIVEVGRDLTEASIKAREYSSGEGIYFLNDATDPDLPAGPAIIACEIFDQLPDADTLIVPVGDTALIRGVMAAVNRLGSEAKVIGVQAQSAPSYYLSWLDRRVVETESCDTIADGLATRSPVETNVSALIAGSKEMLLVSEDEMLTAIRHLLIHEHVVAEPAGAASTAALLQGRADFGTNPVAIVTGANPSLQVLRRALSA